MIPVNLLPILYRVIAALSIAFMLYSGFAYIKNLGYQEAEQKYTAIIKKYEDDVNKKIETVVANSTQLVEEARDSNSMMAKDIKIIMSKVKGQQLTVIKNGECLPSQNFSDTIVELNKRANEKMKGLQK